MNILLSTTSHAAVIAVEDRDQRAVAALPTILEGQDSPLRDQAIVLREAGEAFANDATAIVATFTPAARVEQLQNLAVRHLAKPIQRLSDAGRAEARAIEAAWARVLSVPAADATTAMLRQTDRAAFGRLAIGDKAAWIARAGVDQLGAVIEAGRERANVPEEIWEIAEERYATLNFIRMAGTAADHARQPTVEEPLVIGVDMVAAERSAIESLERHHRRDDIIEAAEQAIQGVTNVVALTCSLDLRAAFLTLTTGKVPA